MISYDPKSGHSDKINLSEEFGINLYDSRITQAGKIVFVFNGIESEEVLVHKLESIGSPYMKATQLAKLDRFARDFAITLHCCRDVYLSGGEDDAGN